MNRTEVLWDLRFCESESPFAARRRRWRTCSSSRAINGQLRNRSCLKPAPQNQPWLKRKDDRQVISGILHGLTSNCRWRNCPTTYGSRTTVDNRFNRGARRGFWRAMLAALAEAGWSGDAAAIDSTSVRAHRSAHGGKGGEGTGYRPVPRWPNDHDPRAHRWLGRPGVLLLTSGNASDVRTAPVVLAQAPGRMRHLAADKGYDADWLRTNLRESGITPVNPGKRGRRR